MKIGKATVPRTAICTSDEHTIVVRGRDLSKELIGKVSFTEHFFLLLDRPAADARRGGGARTPRSSRSPSTASCRACRRRA